MDHESVARRYDAPHEAELAAGYLRSHGIPARVDNDVLQGMNPLWASALGGVRVHVPSERLDEAVGLLSELQTAPSPSDGVDDSSQSSDEEAESEAMDRLAARAMGSTLVGLVFLPIVGQVYSLWLLANVRGAKLSRRGRRNRNLALLVDVAVLGWVAYAVVVALVT